MSDPITEHTDDYLSPREPILSDVGKRAWEFIERIGDLTRPKEDSPEADQLRDLIETARTLSEMKEHANGG